MARIEAIIATSHVDLHHEQLAMSALDGLVDQVNSSYIPNGIEHDPRYPPAGRLLSAELVDLPDGETGVKAVIELFDETTEPGDSTRSVPLHVDDYPRFAIELDRSVAQHDESGDVGALAKLSGLPPLHMRKKALEPLAELVLTIGFVALGAIAVGALEKMGADGWDAVKTVLANRYRLRKHDELFVMRFGVQATRPIEVLVILSNPSDRDVDGFFDMGLREIDELVGYVLSREAGIVRIVFHWVDGHLRLGYAVRWDATPVLVDPKLIPPWPAEWQAALERDREEA
jgi:hypothetical protein